MATKAARERKVVKNIDEFDQKYFPQLCREREAEAETREKGLFAKNLTASLFENVRRKLAE